MGSSGASDDGVIIFTLTIIVPERPNWLIALFKSYSFELGKNRKNCRCDPGVGLICSPTIIRLKQAKVSPLKAIEKRSVTRFRLKPLECANPR